MTETPQFGVRREGGGIGRASEVLTLDELQRTDRRR